MTDTDLRPRATVEFRSAETLGVRHPERIIDVLAMPYERPTNRVVRAGKQIVEVVSRGAFDGVEHRDRIRVYRDHDKTRTTGKVVELNPHGDDGLVARLKISNTPLGDETLELAADGLLDVSVGFAPMAEKYTLDGRQRRLDKCWLDHIALVGDPAYDDARVLDVRSAELVVAVANHPSATPNRDTILAMLTDAGVRLRR